MLIPRCSSCLFIALFFVCTVTTSGIADPLKAVKDSLRPWQPQSVTMEKQTLKVITKEGRVTDTIFKSVIKFGVCAPVWMGNANALDGVSEILVLNKFERQGYVFEGGKNLCDEMGKLNSKEVETYMLGHTHLF